MLNWLKYTFGNFFSHKISKEGKDRSLGNLLFALFVYLLLITSFLASGYSFSYWTHYNNSTSFKEFAYELFNNDIESERVNIQVNELNEEETIINAYFGNDKNNQAIINTFENESDKKYMYNDYNVIVDTTDSSNSFVKFTVTYYNANDKTDTITADEFRNLGKNSGYVGEIDITDELITYTDQQIIEYASWLNILTSTLDATHDYVSEWNTIKALDKESKIYKDKTYALYNRVYYSINVCPTMQNYYQSTYAILDENGKYKYTDCLILTDNWCLISFTTDKGVNLTFDGYYTNFENGFILSALQTAGSDAVNENIDNFFATVFDSVSSVKALFMGVTVFRFYPFLILSLIVSALFIFIVAKIRKREEITSFIDGLKISSGYVLMSSIIAGLIGFIISFISTQQVAYSFASWGLLIVIFIRVMGYVIYDEVSYKNNQEMIEIEKALAGDSYVAPVKKETKKVSKDDEFKMGKM